MLDDILEILLEIIFEGAAAAIGSKHVSLPVRILLAAIILAFWLGFAWLLLAAGTGTEDWKLVLAGAAFLVIGGILGYSRIRRLRKNRQANQQKR